MSFIKQSKVESEIMLYQKYRPKNLDQVEGNVSTVTSLRSVLEKDDIPHAMMFTGPSGCGKTTLARIAAAELGCTGTDFREVDSADFRGIDTVREIRQQMCFSPVGSKCRVWLLDECHKLSNDAQNALLKALEDTPGHVYFLLATTEPKKLLVTVRSRCTTFTVDLLQEAQLVSLMQRVCRGETKRVPKEVIEQIAHDSTGSARVALVVLEKIIDLPKEEMLAAASQRALEENQIIELCRGLMAGSNWGTISGIIKGIEAEPESVRRAILGYFNTVLLSKGDARSYGIMSCFLDNFYDSGKSGLICACYEATTGG